jgi:DNA-binding transcriptional regulator GbsR (MarR family)
MAESEASIVLSIADTIGGLIELWGFKRPMGRIWATLYLSERPLSAGELGERLAMSAGAVSMTTTELVTWGVIKKTWVPGERKDFFEPETSIWKMVSKVYRERELTQIRAAIEVFTRVRDDLAKRRSSSSAWLVARVDTLLQLAQLGESLLAAVLEGKKIDLASIRSFTTAL